MTYERVYTVWQHQAVPRTGVADYQGQPHYYVCPKDPDTDEYGETFLINPVDDETLRVVQEHWGIMQKWEESFRAGSVKPDSHPRIARDDERFEALEAQMPDMLGRNEEKSEVTATFRPVTGARRSSDGIIRDLEVEWTPVAEDR